MNPLVQTFHHLEKSGPSPYGLAVKSLDNLKKTTHGPEQLLVLLMRNVLLTSAEIASCEGFLITLREEASGHEGRQLLRFCQGAPGRKKRALKELKPYLDSPWELLSEGIVEAWQRGDLKFFEELSIGVTSVYYTFWNLIKTVLPSRPDLMEHLSEENVHALKRAVFASVEARLMKLVAS